MNEEDLKKIINLDPNTIPTGMMCEIVESYIKEKKGIVVYINVPTDFMNMQLLQIALSVSLSYFKEKWK